MTKIGLELEFFNIKPHEVIQGFKELGIFCEDLTSEFKKDVIKLHKNHWKLVKDGSVTGTNTGVYNSVGNPCGLELVSPCLQNLEQVEKIVSMLKKIGAKYDKSCGLHIHFCLHSEFMGTKDKKEIAMNILRRFAIHEKFLDEILTGNRRMNRNRYCQSVFSKKYSTGENYNFKELNKITYDEYVYFTQNSDDEKFDNPRYRKLNITNVMKNNTIELRAFQMSLDFKKIKEFILIGKYILGYKVVI